jgi:hypothetical protein
MEKPNNMAQKIILEIFFREPYKETLVNAKSLVIPDVLREIKKTSSIKNLSFIDYFLKEVIAPVRQYSDSSHHFKKRFNSYVS